jgi:hypothetical protein
MSEGPKLDRGLDLDSPGVPRCSLNLSVPWPIDQRLGKLVDLVHSRRLGPTSKRELAAALIQSAETDALALFAKVVEYRDSTVGDAAFWMPEELDPIPFEERKLGRPGRT